MGVRAFAQGRLMPKFGCKAGHGPEMAPQWHGPELASASGTWPGKDAFLPCPHSVGHFGRGTRSRHCLSFLSLSGPCCVGHSEHTTLVSAFTSPCPQRAGPKCPGALDSFPQQRSPVGAAGCCSSDEAQVLGGRPATENFLHIVACSYSRGMTAWKFLCASRFCLFSVHKARVIGIASLLPPPPLPPDDLVCVLRSIVHVGQSIAFLR